MVVQENYCGFRMAMGHCTWRSCNGGRFKKESTVVKKGIKEENPGV